MSISWPKPFFIIAMLVIGFPDHAYAQNSEEELRAAYLFNFSKYIRWPDDQPQFIIAVYGEDTESASAVAKMLKDKKVGGKEIQVKIVSSVEDAINSHILYCTDIENKMLAAVVEMIRGKSILLVTKDDQIRRGAMISFVIADETLKFKVKKDALTKARLVASEGLLRLAIVL